MAEKTETTPAIPADHVKVKVRNKGHGLISTGERQANRDVTYNAGDVITLHKDCALALLNRDLVDQV